MNFAAPRPFPKPGVRRFGRVNWLGLWSLYRKEVRRFLKVWPQTIFAPVLTSLLFFTVFMLALGDARPDIAGLPFATFLAPGLVMMATLQNGFANTSSSVMISKMQGNIVDILMPPLSPGELNAGIAFGGLTRGLVVAISTSLFILPFVDLGIAHVWAVLWFSIAGALIMALTGLIAGIWAEKIDHMQAITQFVITPMTFLSGTFYSLRDLPDFAYGIAMANPFFYLIDGFRYGITGHADGNPLIGMVVTAALAAALWLAAHRLLKSGYRLKA